MPSDTAKQNVLDTSNGFPLEAFYVNRYAANKDAHGKVVDTLGKSFTDAALHGYVSYNGDNIDPLDIIGYNSNVYGTWGLQRPIFLINGTYAPIYLSRDFFSVHGGTQAIYPTYNGKTHQLPAATPHPTEPDQFLLSAGVFCYTANWLGHLAGVLQFSTKKDGAGESFAIALYTSDVDHSINWNATFDLASFGSAQGFYGKTVGSNHYFYTNRIRGSDNLAINVASLPATTSNDFFPNALFIHVYRPDFVYTVQSGDTLGDISRRFYGSPHFYPWIVQANAGKVPNPSLINVGLKLIIPALS